MNRYAIINQELRICDGVYFCRTYAESAAVTLRELFPGLAWKVQRVDEGFSTAGYGHLGEHSVRKRIALKLRGKGNV